MKKIVPFLALVALPALIFAQAKNQTALYIQSGLNLYVETDFQNLGTVNNSGTIHSEGDWTNSGTQVIDGMVIFEGSNAQSVTGTTRFYDAQVDKSASTVTIASGNMQYIRNVLDLMDGTIKTNDNLTLWSDISGTGQISGLGTGSLTDQIIAQRYIDWTYTGLVPNYQSGYHYWSSPVTDATFADYSDDINPFILYDWPGGGSNTSYGTFYMYHEPTSLANSGAAPDYYGKWDAPSSIEIARGYAGHLRVSGTSVTDVVGHYNHSASPSRPLDYTAGVPYQGWNLVGNPYPSGLDWDAPSGWTKTNLNNAIYRWNPVALTYASYVNGIGANGGTRYIAPQQGFFVVANGGGAALGFSNPARVTQSTQFFKTNDQDISLIRMEISNAGHDRVDETVIRIDEQATAEFDGDFDALKMRSPNEYHVDIFTLNKLKEYSINAMPLLEEGNVIPVGIEVGMEGTYTINATALQNLPFGTSVIFVDKERSYRQDLRVNPTYTVSLEQGEYMDRFYLNLNVGEEEVIAGENDYYVYSQNGDVVVQWQEALASDGEVTIFDAIGKQIANTKVYAGMDKVSMPFFNATGYYFVQVVCDEKVSSKPVYLK